MRTNIRTSVVAVMATLCVAMSAGTALAADCGTPWDHDHGVVSGGGGVVSDGGAVFGAAAANADEVVYDGPSGHAVLRHHNVAGVFADHQ